MTLFSYAARNIRRRLFRSIALILSVTLVSGLLFAGAVSMKGVLNSIGIGTKRLGADLMVVPEGYEVKIKTTLIAGTPSVFYMPNENIKKIKKIKGVRTASPQLFIKGTEYECCTQVDAFLIAFDPATDFTITPWLQESINRTLGKDEVIIGRSIPVAKGDDMKFYGKSLKVVGNLSDTGLEYIDHGVFMTFETAIDMIRTSKEKAIEPLKLKEDAISTILIQLNPDISPERAAVFVEYEIPGVKAITSQDVIGGVKRQLFALLRMLLGIGISLWIVTIILIAVVFSMIVNERQREIGILRSIGAKRKSIFSLITAEAFIISLTGGVAGIMTGGALLYVLKGPLTVTYKLPYLWPDIPFITGVIIVTLIVSITTGIAAAFYPAMRCSRMEPYEAIRKGE
ncbi:MAG: FtsX-like permease family protein [Thermodesulfovibrionales bacterium]